MDQSQIQPTRPQDDGLYTVIEGEPEEQHTEKKSLFHKIKGKARKIKKKMLSKNSHGHDDGQQHDRDLSPKDDGSEEFYDEEDDEEKDEPLIHHAPIHDSSAVTGATAGKVGSTENHGNREDFSAELPTITPRVSRDADERVQGLDRKPALKEDPIVHGSTPANYQSEVVDPTTGAVHDTSAVTGATAGKVGSTENHGINFGNKEDFSAELPTSTPHVSRDADERVQGLDRKPVTFEEDPIIHRSTPVDYQSEVAHPTGAVHDTSAVTGAIAGKVGSTENHGINYGNKEDFSAELPTSTLPVSRDADEGVQGLDRKPVTLKEDPIVHGSTPANYQSEVVGPTTGAVHDSSAITGATAGKVGSTENHGINYGNKEDFSAELPTSTPPASRDADERIHGLDRKPVTYGEDPTIQGSTLTNYQSEVADPTGADHEEVKPSPMVESFGKLSVGDEKDSKLDQTPRGTPDDLSSELSRTEAPQSPSTAATGGSYTDKLSYVTSAVTGSAISAKNVATSKLGYGGGATTPAAETELGDDNYVPITEKEAEPNKGYVAGVTEKLAPVYDRVASVGATIVSKVPGTGSRDTFPETETSAAKETDTLGDTDHEEVKPPPMVESFGKLSVGDEKNSKLDQTPRATPDNLSSELSHTEAPQSPSTATTGGSYTDELSYATSAVTSSAISAKNMVTSKLGYGGGATTPAAETELGDDNYVPITEKEAEPNKGYVAGVTEKLAPVYDRVASVGATIVSKVPGTGSRDACPETETITPMETHTPLEADSGADKGYVATVTERLAPVYNVVAGAGTTIMSKVPGTGSGSPTTDTETDTRVERDIGIGTENGAANKGYAAGVTEKLTPVYNKVSSAGTTVMSKFTGSGASAETEGASDKGVPVTEYMSEKTKPNEDDKALSDSIVEALYLKSNDSDEVKPVVKESDKVEKQLGTGDEHNSDNVSGELKVNPGNTGGVVDYVKSWFGKGNEDVTASSPKGQTPHEETGERRLYTNQATEQ